MGRLFSQLFTTAGYQVDILEKGDAIVREQIQRYALVMIAVPMKIALEVTRAIAPHLHREALLFDINSLKEAIVKEMELSPAREVLGLHPMFGPTAQSISGQTIVACKARSGPLTEEVIALFEQQSALLVESTAQEHDRMMARVQALTHFSKLALGAAWRKSGLPLQKSLEFVSPIYLLELSVVGRLFAQDPELYAEIEMANPYAQEELLRFKESVDELYALVNSGDRSAFTRFFTEISSFLQDFSQQAMKLSDSVVEALRKHRV
jgi:prephenate dehydrogenase